jgi:hypothetical protein
MVVNLSSFTDGPTDGSGGEKPEDLVCRAIGDDSASAISNLTSLLNPKFNEDDITILLVSRPRDACRAPA